MIIYFTVILCIFTFFTTVETVRSAPPTIIKGYVYIDGIITEPDEVSLILPDVMRFASVYDDGRYIIIFENEESGIVGTFLIIYQNVNYEPPETVTLQTSQFAYDIDLHIETSGGGQEPPDDPVDTTNIQPKANAGGPYYKIVNTPVDFDASDSYDTDGTITKYEWDFGDGNKATGITTTHTYNVIADYRVKLIVTDNKGKTDLDITYAYISDIPNNPPSISIITCTTTGSVNTKYNYTVLSTDQDNDTLKYYIDWGDETDPIVSDSLQNGTIYTTNHSWIYPGIYKLRAYALDQKDVLSQTAEKEILIDTIYCDNIGYMIDYTNDSIYDLFHSNITREETPVELVNELYLIDDDNDGYPDYQYNITTAETSEYIFQIPTAERTPTFFETIQPYVPHILIIVLAALIASIPVLIYKIRKTPKKKVKKVKEKKKAEKTVSKSEDKSIDDRIKDIEEQVDELPSKKKS